MSWTRGGGGGGSVAALGAVENLPNFNSKKQKRLSKFAQNLSDVM
jgi:hypothetical protein